MTNKRITIIKYLDQLIREEKTGTAQELGNKLGLSKKQTYNYINELKDLGIAISYSKTRKTFYYQEELEFICQVNIKKLATGEMINILGGTQ